MIFRAFLIALLFISHCLTNSSVVAQIYHGGDKKSFFVRIKASIGQSERWNVYDKRIYKSRDGRLVEFYAEFFEGSSEKATVYIDELRLKWKTCSEYEDVINVRDQKVGKRTICEMDTSKKAGKAIIYTYNDILVMISGDSLMTLKIFESETCGRSKRVAGVPCKY